MKMNNIIILVVTIISPLILHAEVIRISNNTESEFAIRQGISTPWKGYVLEFVTEHPFNEIILPLGKIPGFKQFAASYRDKSCWMIPATGKNVGEIPIETQFLLMELDHSLYLMMIPLVDKTTRCSLNGNRAGELDIVAETGDSLTNVNTFTGLYILAGSNPYDMIKQASAEIQQKLQSFKLRHEKPVPWFADYFGWCTWNALYANLNQDTLAYAMNNFKKKNIPVRYMIIDGGWQSSKNRLLDSFDGESSKFPEGIGNTIDMLKNEFELDKVLIWQALWGTFRGLNPESFSDHSKKVRFLPPPRMSYLSGQSIDATIEAEATVGPRFYPPLLGEELYIPADFSKYYNDYFEYLRVRGADGVKVDAMTWIEATGNNRGGRVKVMKDMMFGLQSAINIQFNNELINCSSCSNDYLFNAMTSNVTRSSGDFFPDIPQSHGFHILINAHTSFWMGEIVLPDWDMFQSGHEAGHFHAAARAISGGPIYTTEEIGTENTEILKRLMTSDGRLLRCTEPGRICHQSLFIDPARDERLIKIFNKNPYGGVVGVFNCSFDAEKELHYSEYVSAGDIEGFHFDEGIYYRYSNQSVMKIKGGQKTKITLPELGADIFTFMPLTHGFAPIGLSGKYNPAAAITNYTWLDEQTVTLKILEGTEFLCYAEKRPGQVLVNGNKQDFFYDQSTKVLRFNPEIQQTCIVTIKW